MSGWLERFRNPLLVVLGGVAVWGLVVFIIDQRSGPEPLEIRFDRPLGGEEIRVHVAGAVAQPGVYTLRDGDRAVDALEAAGGPAPDADLTAINLAAAVRDEDQVIVPSRGGATAGSTSQVAAAGSLVNVNTASAELLDTLPGIGEVYSQRIVDSRDTDGPFAAVDDLVTRDVLPRATLDKIRDRITVGP